MHPAAVGRRLGLGLVLLAAACTTGCQESQTGRAVALPTTPAEARAWDGQHIVVENRVAPDHRSYRVEVSRARDGSFCSYLQVSDGSGGSSCGTGDPLTFSSGSDGGVVGVTVARVVTVEVVTASGTIRTRTEVLPQAFPDRRIFAVVLPIGTHPSMLVARDDHGSVVTSQRVG